MIWRFLSIIIRELILVNEFFPKTFHYFLVWSKNVEGQVPCARCTRSHIGGSEKCKSINMMCKRCNEIGHFVEVHDVMDIGKPEIVEYRV